MKWKKLKTKTTGQPAEKPKSNTDMKNITIQHRDVNETYAICYTEEEAIRFLLSINPNRYQGIEINYSGGLRLRPWNYKAIAEMLKERLLEA